MTYIFKIFNGEDYIQVSPIVDIEILKIRGKENHLINRTFFEGKIKLSSNDFDEFSSFANQQLAGKIKVSDGTVYDVVFVFDNLVNFKTKIIEAKVLYNDDYQKIFQEYEKEYNIDDATNCSIFNYSISSNYEEIKVFQNLYVFGFLVKDIIIYLFNKIDSTILFDSDSFSGIDDFGTLAIANDMIKYKSLHLQSDIQTRKDFDTITLDDEILLEEQKQHIPTKISLQDLFDFMQTISIFWYLENSYFRTSRIFNFSSNSTDFSDYENTKNNELEFDVKPKFTQINYPIKNEDSIILFQKKYVNYNYLSDDIQEKNLNLNVDMYKLFIDDIRRIDEEKAQTINIFATEKSNLSFNANPLRQPAMLSPFSREKFFNYNSYLSTDLSFLGDIGDKDIVFEENTTPNLRRIRSRYLFLKVGKEMNISFDYDVNLKFAFGYARVNTSTGHSLSPTLLGYFNGTGSVDLDFTIAAPTIPNIDPEKTIFWFTVDGAGTLLANSCIRNINISDSNSYEVSQGVYSIESFGYLVDRKIPNHKFCNKYLLDNNEFKNMPFNEGVDDELNVYSFLKKNDVKRKIITNFAQSIKDIDFNQKMIDSEGGEWRIDKITRKIKKEMKSVDFIEISKIYA